MAARRTGPAAKASTALGPAIALAMAVVVAVGLLTVPAASADETPGPRTLTYTYCVQQRGVDAGQRDGFERTARHVLADPDGWSLGGTIRFEGRDGCDGADFTLWLAAASRVAEFGPVCSSEYSCRVGRDVVVNLDRWRYATSAWHRSDASLADYRRMVITHEVGHWLGFGHADCPRPGAPAPVMQQQSMDLQGCTPNSYPTDGERQRLAIGRDLSISAALGDDAGDGRDSPERVRDRCQLLRANRNVLVYAVPDHHRRRLPEACRPDRRVDDAAHETPERNEDVDREDDKIPTAMDLLLAVGDR